MSAPGFSLLKKTIVQGALQRDLWNGPLEQVQETDLILDQGLYVTSRLFRRGAKPGSLGGLLSKIQLMRQYDS